MTQTGRKNDGAVRIDGRRPEEPRAVKIVPGYQQFAEGSALIETGLTQVLCAASVDERVPPFLKGTGKGWVTAEYAMLPRSTLSRTPREVSAGRARGRTMEIQRMVGRCLRAVTDLESLGERTVQIDCDVLQADGGTRTAAVTGAYVALYQACQTLRANGVLDRLPLVAAVAAISVGLVRDRLLVDLAYSEDQVAQVDFNLAMTDQGDLVEIQGAAEGRPFPQPLLQEVISMGHVAMQQLFEAQRTAIASLKAPAS